MKVFANKVFYGLTLLAISVVCMPVARAQDDTSSAPSPADGAPPAATAPAEQNAENPPLSGLDAPSAEPVYGGRSYLIPGLQLSESVDSNANGSSAKGSHTSEVSRGLGSVDLQKIWKTYQVGLDYIAGGVVYLGPRPSTQGRSYQVHTFAANQRILWRTGQLVFRDSFDYLPEGTFGFSSFGGAGSFGSTLGGGSAGTGLGGGVSGGTPGGISQGQYGSIGIQPRIDNLAVVDVTQALSPRSSVTLAGGYDFTDYLNKSQATFNIINSQQTTAQAGYNHLLNRKDQIGFLYAFQEFHFPRAGSGSVNVHVWNALYGHRISGRLNLVVGGGPQLLVIHNPPIVLLGLVFPVPTTQRISGNGNVRLGYTFSSRTSVQLGYQHYVTPGSGFLAGANTDAVRLSLSHVFGRRWTGTADGGYSHNSSLLQKGTTSAGLGARSYQYWYSGASLHRQLGQHFAAFVSYQFNDFGSTGCAKTGTTCGQTSQRHTGIVGIDWHPHPIRLD